MNCLLHPTYFPNIAHFVAMINAENIYFEVWDNYQKQSYRNRTEIYGANGKLALTVPVIYTQKNRQLYKDVLIANKENWQLLHLKSLQSAYRMSPFFEYYEADLMPLFEKRFNYLLDFNFECFDIVSKCMELKLHFQETETFEKTPNDKTDFRNLVRKKNEVDTLKPYTQVFTEKHGFIPNLSILDLLFNEGPNTELYLNKQILAT
ncbi:WbqC family protein [Winogradskyella ursingii]|uniref:WbqC family protein n=1 Tax=Winogradskyella ursingii TaxID=2686079 RepID=UPI0015C9182B|nr:WbqC family protein [Winogradskyella ursingii]